MLTPAELLDHLKAYEMCYDPQAQARWFAPANDPTVHVFLAELNGVPQVMFEGTQSGKEWFIDFEAVWMNWPKMSHPELGPLAENFWLNAEQVVDPIYQFVSELGRAPYDISGHSKGGPEAQAMAAMLTLRGMPPRKLVLFESARLGTEKLRDFLLNAGIEVAQTQTFNAHGADPVTEVPPWYVDIVPSLRLNVPDDYDLAQKHRIAGVRVGLEALVAP